MSSKQNIKEAIILLCNIINHHHDTLKLTPETLRLAKFNKDEATEPMWRLLFQTDYFLNNISFKGVAGLLTKEKQDLVLCTKHKLFMKGYYVRDFFSLPNDMECGSREVLLAFGWLISQGEFLRILVDNCSSLIQECLPLNEELSANARPVLLGKSSTNNSEDLSLDRLSWVIGNLRLRCNALYSAESNLVSLVDKVHCATCGAKNSKGYLSLLEVFLLRHPKELIKFQEKLEWYNSYLGNLLKFVDLQTVFWKWIKSVYEAKLSERNTNNEMDLSPSSSQCVTCKEIAKRERTNVSNIQSEIQKVLNDDGVFYQKACEILKRNESCKNIGLNIQEWSELNEQIMSLSLNESPEVCRNKGETFPELMKLTQSDLLAGKMKSPEPSCAKQIISLLKSKLSLIEVELMETKNQHFNIMNDLTANIQELVCIPPIESSKYLELRNK